MKISGTLLVAMLFFASAGAVDKYWVTFTDKHNVVFDPLQYFSKRTIEQRLLYNIPVNDSSDYPLNATYLSDIKKLVDSVSSSSRWLNGIAVYADEEKINTLKQLPFVKGVFSMSNTKRFISASKKTSPNYPGKYEKALLKYQLQRLQGDSFIVNGFDGTGIRIAVFDAGFPNVDKHPAFENVRKNKKIVATYDFVKHAENVFQFHWHGTATLSCIVGKKDSANIGLATGAELLLARTENGFSESFSEEENWLAAAEWADKLGANIISSSLGYTENRYFNNQMDGHTSLIARSATVAASKGILVVNAAGNECTNNWHYIATPGDADSVLTVGGTDPETDSHIFFSSLGPSSNGKLKPNVSAPGRVVAANKKKLAQVSGTSFSAPIVAGFAACAWQSHRQWNNMELFNAIEKSSHLYPYYDYAHGFGIPQASWFLTPPKEKDPTFDFVIINNEIKVVLREQFSYSDTEEALGYIAHRNFYYKVEDKSGSILRYTTLLAEGKEMLHLLEEQFQIGDVLTVHFEGYTRTLIFPLEK